MTEVNRMLTTAYSGDLRILVWYTTGAYSVRRLFTGLANAAFIA